MIIEVEDRLCKVAKQFVDVLERLERAAASGDAVHEVEETAWFGLIEVGREMIVAYIKQREEELPRPKVIEQEGKKLRRLPKRRTRQYVSAFGPTPFRRDVYATRETQRQEVVPLDAKLGMPERRTRAGRPNDGGDPGRNESEDRCAIQLRHGRVVPKVLCFLRLRTLNLTSLREGRQDTDTLCFNTPFPKGKSTCRILLEPSPRNHISTSLLPANGKRQNGRFSGALGRFVAQQLTLVEMDSFSRSEIENRSAFGFPMVTVEAKLGGGNSEVPYRSWGCGGSSIEVVHLDGYGHKSG